MFSFFSCPLATTIWPRGGNLTKLGQSTSLGILDLGSKIYKKCLNSFLDIYKKKKNRSQSFEKGKNGWTKRVEIEKKKDLTKLESWGLPYIYNKLFLFKVVLLTLVTEIKNCPAKQTRQSIILKLLLKSFPYLGLSPFLFNFVCHLLLSAHFSLLLWEALLDHVWCQFFGISLAQAVWWN